MWVLSFSGLSALLESRLVRVSLSDQQHQAAIWGENRVHHSRSHKVSADQPAAQAFTGKMTKPTNNEKIVWLTMTWCRYLVTHSPFHHPHIASPLDNNSPTFSQTVASVAGFYCCGMIDHVSLASVHPLLASQKAPPPKTVWVSILALPHTSFAGNGLMPKTIQNKYYPTHVWLYGTNPSQQHFCLTGNVRVVSSSLRLNNSLSMVLKVELTLSISTKTCFCLRDPGLRGH